MTTTLCLHSAAMSAAASADALTDRELAAWRGMLEVNARVTRRLDAEMRAAHGLSVSAYEVLMFLGDAPAGRLRMAEIADRALLSRSGLTRLIDRLVALGYVERCAAEDDGRGLYAQLTDAGRAVLGRARETHYRGVRRHFLDRLGPADQMTLGEIWDRLSSAG